MVERSSEIEERIIEGLSQGTPLAVLCREEGMPHRSCVYDWMDEDEELSRRIARARDAGFDVIASDCLTIADDVDEDPASRRVRTDVRLKLLAKWDPKRYGDKQLLGSDPDNPLPAGVVVTFRKSDAASPD